MYKEYENCLVSVIVSSRGDAILEYTGIFLSESGHTIQLGNASITRVLQSLQKSMFGSEMMTYKRNIPDIIINKEYIISCNKID